MRDNLFKELWTFTCSLTRGAEGLNLATRPHFLLSKNPSSCSTYGSGNLKDALAALITDDQTQHFLYWIHSIFAPKVGFWVCRGLSRFTVSFTSQLTNLETFFGWMCVIFFSCWNLALDAWTVNLSFKSNKHPNLGVGVKKHAKVNFFFFIAVMYSKVQQLKWGK